jgi:hypothetical protein
MKRSSRARGRDLEDRPGSVRAELGRAVEVTVRSQNKTALENWSGRSIEVVERCYRSRKTEFEHRTVPVDSAGIRGALDIAVSSLGKKSRVRRVTSLVCAVEIVEVGIALAAHLARRKAQNKSDRE